MPGAGAEGRTARVMAAGGDPRTRRRPGPAFSAKPAGTLLRAALTAPALRGAGGSQGRGGAGRDGQRDCPIRGSIGQRGREGAGSLSRCKGQAPAGSLILPP